MESFEGQLKQNPRLWTLSFCLILATTLCCFTVGQGVNTGTSLYLDRIGYSASFAGILATVFSFSAGVMRLIVGPIIDAGKTSLVVIAGMAVLAVATLLPLASDNAAVFVLSRAMQGAGFSMASTAAATAAADVLPKERLGEGLGYHGLGQAISLSLGPAFALYLVGTDPVSNIFVGLGLVGIVGFVFGLFARYERHPEKLPDTSACRQRLEQKGITPDKAANSKKGLATLFERRALAGAIPMGLLYPVFGFGIFFAGLYGEYVGVGNPSLFYTVAACSMIACRLTSGIYMDCIAPIKIYTVAILCGMATFVLLLLAEQHPALFYLAGAFYGLCQGISMPLNQSVAVKNTTPDRWGAANALVLLMNDITIGIAAALWGFLNDSFGFQVTLVCSMACIVISYVSAWIVYPESAKRWRHA